MLAFHNEHIASCAFLTYFTPDSTTASTSPTALTTAAAATILNDKQALTGILMRPNKPFTNFARRLHPYEFTREGGGGVGGTLVPSDVLKTLQPSSFMPMLQENILQSYQHHYHLHHSLHHPNRIFKDYLSNNQASKPRMPSLILNSPKQHYYQDEQHQFILNRTSSTASSTLPSTTTTTTSISSTSPSASSSAMAVTAADTTTSKQHQCSNDFVQIKSNLVKL
ncbi:uncharacterized protein [Musca autumnalis]|uniref:uncharacterized protein n=1 Tax=Musca autumnalis TaxID=221902 RepID=UPI003CF840BD